MSHRRRHDDDDDLEPEEADEEEALEDEEEDEDYDDTSRSRKRARSQFIDDVAEEDDEEDEEEDDDDDFDGGRRGAHRAKRRSGSQFLDLEAAVDSDEEEEDEDGEDDFIVDGGAEIPDEDDGRRIHRRPLLPREDDQEDVEALERSIQARYARSSHRGAVHTERKKEMDNITASEVAGFGVGTLLLCATIAAPKVDSFISASQRSSLGMCKRCGDLRIIACSKCKGAGSIKAGGPFSLNLVDDLYQSIGGGESKLKSIACSNCQARGHFCCPDCSTTQ